MKPENSKQTFASPVRNPAERDAISNGVNLLKAYLETEKAFGCEEYLLEDAPLTKSKDKDADHSLINKEKLLTALSKRVSSCKKCELSRHRRNVVFGKGNPQAKLLFIGEAPGEEEDLMGEPFVGRAGMLLTRIINAMGLERKEVYIANCIKCRPPQNRPPDSNELKACEEYLIEQVNIIKPKLICALGKYAAWNLLKREEPISTLRGKLYEFNTVKVIPTFHPAYLLRNPKDKALVWEDMKKAIKFLKDA